MATIKKCVRRQKVRDGVIIIDVNAEDDSYSEKHYPENKGKGIHGVAKLCRHEMWHGVLREEVRPVWRNGLGHVDSDGDGLSDTREDEIGTKIDVKDTCGIANYAPEYSVYAKTGDQELFCRWKQKGILGDESKDWDSHGQQSYYRNK